MSRILIIAGVALVLIGGLWPWLSKLPIGRLPGDFVLDRPGVKVYFPFATTLLVSGVLSLLVWLLRR